MLHQYLEVDVLPSSRAQFHPDPSGEQIRQARDTDAECEGKARELASVLKFCRENREAAASPVISPG